jgi:hypothetical protein
MIEELPVIRSGHRLQRILTWSQAGALTPTELNRLLAEWWTSCEWICNVGRSRLTRMFKYAGFVTDAEGVTAPTAPMTLYRGAGVHNYRGLAWTTDERVAAWFARRVALVDSETYPQVYSITIAPQHVLGIFHGRNEAEVVINLFALRGRLALASGIPVTEERIVRLAAECSAMRQSKGTP